MLKNLQFTSKNRVLISLIFFLLCGHSFFASAGYVLDVYVDRSEILYGETINLSIKTYLPPFLPFRIFGVETLEENFFITLESTQSIMIEPDLQMRIFIYKLDPKNPGAYQILPLELIVVNQSMAKSEAIYLDVYEENEKFGLLSEKHPFLEKKTPIWTVLFFAFFVTFSVFALKSVILLKKKIPESGKRKKEKIYDVTLVFRKFQDLKRRKSMITDDDLKREFYYEMNFLIREYIDSIHKIDLLENTTSESKILFENSNKMGEITENEIIYFLDNCDRVKYSKFIPDNIRFDEDFDNFRVLFAKVLTIEHAKYLQDKEGIIN